MPAAVAWAFVMLMAAGAATTPGALTQADVGRVEFATSGSPEAQRLFLRGLAQLHNFEYDDAAADFRAAQALEPGFAMAYWGEAMTKNHPIWMEQDQQAARAILLKLGPTLEARLAKAPTQREKDYIRTLDVLYGGTDAGDGGTSAGGSSSTSGGTSATAATSAGADPAPPAEAARDKWRRDAAYAGAMEALHAKYPDDVDAAAFHALAVLGTAHAGRDFGTYMRSAAILEAVFPTHPGHPGVVHYLIHSYDDPVHAPLGLRAARIYSRIAPAAPHAQHMTSHIFLALGMWDDVIAANETAAAVVNRRRGEKGQPPRACGHYIAWLEYGYLQQGRVNDAREVLDACLAQAAAPPAAAPVVAGAPATGAAPASSSTTAAPATPAPGSAPHVCAAPTAATVDPDQSPAGSAAQMWSRFLLDSNSPAAVLLAMTPPEVTHPAARMTLETARGLVAARAKMLPQAREAQAAARRAAGELAALLDRDGTDEGHQKTRARILDDELAGAILVAEGRNDEGLDLMRRAAKDEESLPMDFGPPFIDKPSYELLGETLVGMGRAVDARAAFESALARAPNRTRSVAGLKACAAVAGSQAAPAAGGR